MTSFTSHLPPGSILCLLTFGIHVESIPCYHPAQATIPWTWLFLLPHSVLLTVKWCHSPAKSVWVSLSFAEWNYKFSPWWLRSPMACSLLLFWCHCLQLYPSYWPQSTRRFPSTLDTCFFCMRHCSLGGACGLLSSLLQLCVRISSSPSLTTLVHLCLVPQSSFKIFIMLPSHHVPVYDRGHYRAFVVYGWSLPFRIGTARETGIFLLHLVCVVHWYIPRT